MEIVKTKKTGVDVSFVIPAYNEEKYLPIVLKSIHDQETNLVGEIILIDDQSKDQTSAIAKEFGCRIYKSKEKANVQRMRNDGLDKAYGTCILYVDADCAFSKNYIEVMARPIAEGRVEASLALKSLPLETTFPLFPEQHSSYYRVLLERLPKIYWLKIPIRFFIWLTHWFKQMRKEKKIVSPLTIPDRVHTSAIITRTEIVKKAGGWQNSFGFHDDTQYCLDIFKHTDKTRWHWSPTLYISKRREFPLDNKAFLGKMLREFLKNFGITIRAKGESRDKKGYTDPEGVR